MRLKAIIAYDGTEYYGWQIQRIEPTIQSMLENCLEHVCKHPVGIQGAGRTDSGVHAYAQVAHFDWDHVLPPEKLILAMNALLPPDIRVLQLNEVDPKFHSRFDAQSKSYLYRINRDRFASPFEMRYSLHYSYPLDHSLLAKCASLIEGEHDFAAFQATGADVVSTIRKVQSAQILSMSDATGSYLCMRIQANGFLRKMVRFLVGTMLEISGGKRELKDLQLALESGDRRYTGVPAAAHGLFLEKVYYTEEKSSV